MTEPESHDDGLDRPIDAAADGDAGEPSLDPDSTVGTGSVFAIGCSIVVFLIILAGVAYFVARQLD